MKKEITFSYPAEAMQGATEIFLVGDFNDWNIEDAIKFEYAMDGFFKAVAELEEGQTYNYRFLLDNGRWVNDHNAQSYVVIPELYVDNCVITVPFSVIEEMNVTQKGKSTKDNKSVETKTKSAPKAKKVADTDSKKSTVETASKKATPEVSPKKGSTVAAPKTATAQPEPAKASGTKKPAAKVAKASANVKATPAPAHEAAQPAKAVKKSVTKGK